MSDREKNRRMRFSTHFKFIFSILLLLSCLTDVHAGKSDGPDINDSKNLLAASDSQEKENTITATFTGLSNVGKKDKSFSFSTDESSQATLRFPAKIEVAKFNDKTLLFEDGAKLPNSPVSLFFLYTCEHGVPVLVNFKSQNQNYFYGLNKEGSGWTNFTLDSLKKYAKTDANGVTYYEHDADEKKSKDFSSKFDKKLSKLSKKKCKRECKGTVPQDSTIEITLKPEQPKSAQPEAKTETTQSDKKAKQEQPKQQLQQPQQSSSNNQAKKKDSDPNLVKLETSFSYTHQTSEKQASEGDQQAGQRERRITLFTYYSYAFDQEDRDKMKKSKQVTQLTFGGKLLEFEDSAKLPNHTGWLSLVVLICQHNQLVTIRFKVTESDKNYHYYYVPDTQTKKLKNTAVRFVEEQEEKDSKGLTRYTEATTPTAVSFGNKLSQKWEETFSEICQSHEQSTESLNEPPIEITIA